MRFPEEQFQNASPAAVKAAAKKHARALFKRAHEAVEQQRQALLQDAEARAEAGLGEVKLTSSAPDDLTVQDLDPIAPATKGFGYSTDYNKRAEAAGLEPDALAAEAAAAKPPPDPAKPNPGAARREAGEKIAAELEAIRAPGPAVDTRAVVDAKKAVELLRAEKALRAVQREARDKARLIDGAKEPVEPKAYILETGGPVDHDVVRDLENDLRTISTRAFLDQVGREGGADGLGRHVGVGAYNSVNALALAAGGASLVDRSVVDVLGVAGAAQVLARRLRTDLTPDELDHVRQAMGSFHTAHYMALSDQALREAREWHEMAHEIEVGEAATGAELAVAQELNARRRAFTGNARRVLGTALGEMEANAALVLALEQPAKAQVQVSLGGVAIEDAIRQARAIGLDRGDYQVERAGALDHADGQCGRARQAGAAGLPRYAAMQDVVRSKLLGSFAEHHNKLRPDAPLKLGRTVIRGDLDHLDALDPVARERRLAKHCKLADSLRNRAAGKYASGSVAETMGAMREAEEAASQHQGGSCSSVVASATTTDVSVANPVPQA